MSEGKLHRTTEGLWLFWCPGCEEYHSFDNRWTKNGTDERPTFTPSLLYATKTPRCHLWLTDGVLVYLEDCEHHLKGQRVPLGEFLRA